ncbi:hypothetical protein GY45DRAFT_1219824, partial [Cubamyces sp. BRFM 1775]
MSPGDRLRRFRSFPKAPAPNDDIAAVKSNLPSDAVELQQNILAYHVAHHPGSSVFGHDQAKGLKLVELYVRPRSSEDDDPARKARMLNVHGTLAGPCLTLFLDVASFSALFALGTIVNMDPSGFSTSMNIVWHAPATRGMTLRFVNRSLSLTPRLGAARCEVYDKRTGRLLASATQIVSPIQALPAPGS